MLFNMEGKVEDNMEHRVRNLENRVDMLAQQLREHDQVVQYIVNLAPTSQAGLVSLSEKLQKEKCEMQERVQIVESLSASQQKVLADLIQLISEERFTPIDENNAVEHLKKIIDEKHELKKKYENAMDSAIKRIQALLQE